MGLLNPVSSRKEKPLKGLIWKKSITCLSYSTTYKARIKFNRSKIINLANFSHQRCSNRLRSKSMQPAIFAEVVQNAKKGCLLLLLRFDNCYNLVLNGFVEHFLSSSTNIELYMALGQIDIMTFSFPQKQKLVNITFPP